MKKALSVIFALVLIFGIFAVGASAAKKYDLSFKSGDVVDYSLYSSQIPYTRRKFLVVEFNADTSEPIYGGIYKNGSNEWCKGFGINPSSSRDITATVIDFGGIGPILVNNKNAFSSNKITELNIPSNVYAFDYAHGGYETALSESQLTGEPLKSGEGTFMFADCSSLRTVTIDNPSDVLFDWGFYNCTRLEKVNFTDKVTTICRGMFESCMTLTSIEIPPSITKICDCAFYNTWMRSVYIPGTVKTIEPYALGYQGKAYKSKNYLGIDVGDCADYIDSYPDDYNITKINGFKIYGESGSEAERYANENGFEFIDLEQIKENKVYSAKVKYQAYLGENATITVDAGTGADKIQFINSSGQTITYTRDSANVKSIESSSYVTETWTINLCVYKPTETYRVKAKYGKTWATDENAQFTLNEKLREYKKGVALSQLIIPGSTGSYAVIKVVAGGSPSKIQFRTDSGSTVTYTRDDANVIRKNHSDGSIIDGTDWGPSEEWFVKVKVSKPSENYTVAAKYNTGWSDETKSITVNGIAKSSETLSIGQIRNNYNGQISYTHYLVVGTASETKRIVLGNVFEGNYADIPIVHSRNSMHDSLNDEDHIFTDENGREYWHLVYEIDRNYMISLPTNEVQYISAEMADGSWAVAGFIIEEVDGQRIFTQVDIDSPQKVNSADVTVQNVLGGYADVEINVGKGASKIQFANSSGNTLTYTRSSSAVNSISQSGDNEIWTISLKVYRPSDTYTVKAKYGREWTIGTDVTFTVTAQ